MWTQIPTISVYVYQWIGEFYVNEFPTFSFDHRVVCFSIYGLWLPLWYLQTLLPIYDEQFLLHMWKKFPTISIYVYQWMSKWLLFIAKRAITPLYHGANKYDLLKTACISEESPNINCYIFITTNASFCCFSAGQLPTFSFGNRVPTISIYVYQWMSKWLLFIAKRAITPLYHGANKYHSIRWLWYTLCTRPSSLDINLVYDFIDLLSFVLSGVPVLIMLVVFLRILVSYTVSISDDVCVVLQ
jgi:hypothetical protein